MSAHSTVAGGCSRPASAIIAWPTARLLLTSEGATAPASFISGAPPQYNGFSTPWRVPVPSTGRTPPGRNITVRTGNACSACSVSPLMRSGISRLSASAPAPDTYSKHPCGLAAAHARATASVVSSVTRRYSASAVPTGGAPAQ
ncbi:hypothetical protein G6F23_013935 [Rhizopus arrhizus]|nr:hypothetical protein G6F23_013935 [Rhizopus arrhizus]